MKDIRDLLCPVDINLTEAFRRLNQNGKGILFVVDRNLEFVGTLTDGDLRRGILTQKSIDFKIAECVCRHALTAGIDEKPQVIIEQIKKRPIPVSIVPLLEEGRVVDYFEFKSGFHFPIASSTLDGDEILNLIECVNTNWISSQGRFVRKFEDEFANKYQTAFGVATMNGTAALHLALSALGIGPGDEVIVPSLTFAATVNAVIYTGATPVIVDVDQESWCLDPEAVEEQITSKTKAIIPVHLYGQPCDMEKIESLAKKNNVKVIEDCAQAPGAKFGDRFVGTIGDIGCFSFFGNKIITTGEGGMCLTKSPELNEKMRLLRDHGMDRTRRGYYHTAVGFNYRMTNMQAAVGVAQLEKIDKIHARRLEIEKIYQKKMSRLSSFQAQQNLPNRKKVCWLVSFLFENKGLARDDLIDLLVKKGIDVRAFFIPMHEMKIYEKYTRGDCPVAGGLSRKGLNFPTTLDLTEEKITTIVNMIRPHVSG